MPPLPTPLGPQMSQDQANVLQGSRPLGPPLVAPQFRPALSRENPFQQDTLPPTAASESREPLSVNFHNLLQHRSLPGQQHSGPQRALFVQQGGQPSAGAVGDPELQRGSSVDRRKKGSWKRRRESFDLPSRCIVPQCNGAAPTCCAQCTSVSLQLPLCFVVHSASVPDALKQLDLNQYLELMEDNEVGGGAERGGEGRRGEWEGRGGEAMLKLHTPSWLSFVPGQSLPVSFLQSMHSTQIVFVCCHGVIRVFNDLSWA